MPNNKTIITEYLDLAKKYKQVADAALAELNKCKQEISQLKTELLDRVNDGQYLWDSKRIVISAPEIIIGNVDKFGDLQEGGRVIIKGNALNLDGVGETGNITMRAPMIEERAVNPGVDGYSDIVETTSSIVSVARGVQLCSQAPQTVVGRGAAFLPVGKSPGVNISSDGGVNIGAKKAKANRKTVIDNYKAQVSSLKDETKGVVDGAVTTLEQLDGEIKQFIESDKDLTQENDLTKTNILALDELNSKMGDKITSFSNVMKSMMINTAKLAESNRKIACLDKELEELNKVDDDKFKKESQKTNITLTSECINLLSMDGEGLVRTNEDAGIKLQGNKIELSSTNEKGSLTPADSKGRITIQSRNVDITTADLTGAEYDDKRKLKKAKFPLVGNVSISSKTINMDSMDLEQTEPGKFKQTALTADSEVNIRAKKVKVKTIDEKGKSVGKFSVNSQLISMKATDIKEYKDEVTLDDQDNVKHPEKMSSDKVAEGSKMLLLTETINIGYKNDQFISKDLFADSQEKTIIYGGEGFYAGQGKHDSLNSVLFLEKSNGVTFSSGSKMQVVGKSELSLYGKTTVNGKMEAGDVEVANLTASKSVTAPNLADGTKMPAQAKEASVESGQKIEESKI